MMNENAMANVLVDVDFLEEQFKSAGRPNVVSLFSELRAVRPHPLSLNPYFFFNLAPLADNIDRPLRFRRRIPRTIATPDDLCEHQAKEAHCGA